MVRDAHDRRARLRIAGARHVAGTRRRGGAGRRRRSTSRVISGIVEYVPGDLTLTARAGTTIAEARRGDPPRTDSGARSCRGAATTARSARPSPPPRTDRAARTLGAPRDIALGIEFVDGTGAVVRAGGRVVKNVAGFDLTRLLVGSWGSLGVITELSLRLRARPVVDETWSVAMEPGDGARAGSSRSVAGRSRRSRSRRLEGRTLVRLGGNAAFVAASREIVRALGTAEPCDPGIWCGSASATRVRADRWRRTRSPIRLRNA